MAQKPSIPKGTRDFSPAEMGRRNYIFDTIRQVFKLHGYRPIETPAMENLSTLMGKYGEEGDKLLFRILNSGEYLRGVDHSLVENEDYPRLTSKKYVKKAYDMTSLCHLQGLSCSTATSCNSLSKDIRYNPYGGPTGLKRSLP